MWLVWEVRWLDRSPGGELPPLLSHPLHLETQKVAIPHQDTSCL